MKDIPDDATNIITEGLIDENKLNEKLSWINLVVHLAFAFVLFLLLLY